MRIAAIASIWVALSIFSPYANAQPPVNAYSISSVGWQRNFTPNGEVFTCSTCGAQIQVQIDIGPSLPPDSKIRTNEQFLAQFRTPEQQQKLAEEIVRSQIPLKSGIAIRIEKTGFTKVGGLDAVQFAAVVTIPPTTMRDTTMLLVHKTRIVKVTLNYYDGAFTPQAREAVSALFSSLKFL